MRKYCTLLPLLLSLSGSLFAQTAEIRLAQGLVIRQSCQVAAAEYRLSTALPDSLKIGVVRIEGDGLVVDFQGAELVGAEQGQLPDRFSGTAISVSGKNITIRNARARGYKVALYAEGVENLVLDNCDFSYNYRPRLRSLREREDFSDWLSYHQNEQDEWLRYGTAIYLKNCQGAVVRGCRVSGCQNALLMSGCNGATVYNNFFTFNSGLGIGLYRSSRNRIMHNRLDWNVRGYSHGFYQRGQDSAGILLYEQSSYNTIAYNSATHSGDGLFLWAGQSTMDTGLGGCNDNVIFGNDFSYAPTNGVEVTFSRNRIQGNIIQECTYGIWGGYSYNTKIMGNFIADCKTGVAIEHGQNDTIQQNLFQKNQTAVQLWARESQPSNWGYAKKRDTRSRDHLIDRNVFLNNTKVFSISRSSQVAVNGQNLFYDFEQMLESKAPNEGFKFWRNDLYATEKKLTETWAQPELKAFQSLNFSHPGQGAPENPYAPLDIPYNELTEPDSLPDGMVAALPARSPKGRRFIIVGEWGPYDFRYPIATLDTIAGNRYSIALIGPAGTWSLRRSVGLKTISARTGMLPATLTAERDPNSDELYLEFESQCNREIVTVFGEKIPPAQPYRFAFDRFEKKMTWELRYFEFSDSIPDRAVFEGKPKARQTVGELAFAWWGSPLPEVASDKFATLAETAFNIAAGEYTIELSSDDGVRLYLDEKCVIDHWDVHEPSVDEISLKLGGQHKIRIEHFDAGGFAALDFRIRRVRG